MGKADSLATTIKELKKTTDEKIARLKTAVKESKESQQIQTEPQRRQD